MPLRRERQQPYVATKPKNMEDNKMVIRVGGELYELFPKRQFSDKDLYYLFKDGIQLPGEYYIDNIGPYLRIVF